MIIFVSVLAGVVFVGMVGELIFKIKKSDNTKENNSVVEKLYKEEKTNNSFVEKNEPCFVKASEIQNINDELEETEFEK